MADAQMPQNQPASKPPVKERQSVLDMLRARREKQVDPEREQRAAEEFDQDFNDLRKIVEKFSYMSGAVVTDDGLELDVDGVLIDKIIVRKIEQSLRFDAAEGYPMKPRYEIVIKYRSENGDMADTLVVDYEELFKKPTDETVRVIKERLLEAKRSSSSVSNNMRVWAIHNEVQRSDGTVKHIVRSDGTEITNHEDYDARVRVEIEKAIDAIRSAIALQEAQKKMLAVD